MYFRVIDNNETCFECNSSLNALYLCICICRCIWNYFQRKCPYDNRTLCIWLHKGISSPKRIRCKYIRRGAVQAHMHEIIWFREYKENMYEWRIDCLYFMEDYLYLVLHLDKLFTAPLDMYFLSHTSFFYLFEIAF